MNSPPLKPFSTERNQRKYAGDVRTRWGFERKRRPVSDRSLYRRRPYTAKSATSTFFPRAIKIETFLRPLTSRRLQIMPRAQKPASRPKHDPLHIQLHEDSVHAKYGDVSQPGKRKKSKRDKSDRESEDEARPKEIHRGCCNLSLCRLR